MILLSDVKMTHKVVFTERVFTPAGRLGRSNASIPESTFGLGVDTDGIEYGFDFGYDFFGGFGCDGCVVDCSAMDVEDVWVHVCVGVRREGSITGRGQKDVSSY
jgi:hypothetical protein